MHLVLPVALQHCELIEIGQQRAISRIHVASSSNEKLYQCCQKNPCLNALRPIGAPATNVRNYNVRYVVEQGYFNFIPSSLKKT
jgi:hypothetical protein